MVETLRTHPDNIPPPQSLLALIGQAAEMRRRGERVTSLAGGLPPKETLREIWKRVPDVVERLQEQVGEEEALQYNDASGNWRLRGWAADNVSHLTGRETLPENILTVSGLQSGILTTLGILCARENKIALTQTPTYAGFLEAAEDELAKAPVVSVDSDEQGIIPLSLEHILGLLEQKKVNPGLVYTMAVANPNGGIMSDRRGKEINDICREHKIPLFVDYAYYGLTFSTLEEKDIPKITYLDKNVILGFSASKLGFPGARVGYMAIQDKELYGKIKDLKQRRMIMSPPLEELIIHALFNEEDSGNRVKRTATVYEERAKRGMDAVDKNSDIFSADRPQGGMFLWVKVNNGASTWQPSGRILKEQGIAYAPGRWSQPQQLSLPDGTVIGVPVKDDSMRLCVTTEEPQKVVESINRLAETFRKG